MSAMRIRSVALLPDSRDYVIVCGHGRTAGGHPAEPPPHAGRPGLRDALARHYALQGARVLATRGSGWPAMTQAAEASGAAAPSPGEAGTAEWVTFADAPRRLGLGPAELLRRLRAGELEIRADSGGDAQRFAA